jgi:hypothetical protein
MIERRIKGRRGNKERKNERKIERETKRLKQGMLKSFAFYTLFLL